MSSLIVVVLDTWRCRCNLKHVVVTIVVQQQRLQLHVVRTSKSRMLTTTKTLENNILCSNDLIDMCSFRKLHLAENISELFNMNIYFERGSHMGKAC